MKDSYVFYKDKLDAHYKPVFEQIELYVSTRNIDESTLEERLGDLLDIFISAQEAQKPVEQIVGHNLERFCKTFCADLGVKNRIFGILDLLKTAAWMLAICVGVDLLFLFLDAESGGQIDFWHVHTSEMPGVYVTALLMAYIVVSATNLIIQHIMFKTKRFSTRALNIVLWVEALALYAGMVLAMTHYDVDPLPVPAWVVVVVSCGYLLVYYLLCGKRDKRAKITLTELAQPQLNSEIDSVMQKQFEKAKKKALKKGKGELTMQEFLDKQEAECAKLPAIKRFYIGFPIFLVAISYVWTYLSGGFESVLDSALFLVVMLAVEGLLMGFLWKVVKSGMQARLAWVKEKRASLDGCDR